MRKQGKQRIKLIDTVYLVAYINPTDKLHKEALQLIENINQQTLVSSYALIEFDLIMKSRGFTEDERIDTWTLLETKINGNIASPHPQDHRIAAELQKLNYDYFDSLIASQAVRLKAQPQTTDKMIIQAYNKITKAHQKSQTTN